MKIGLLGTRWSLGNQGPRQCLGPWLPSYIIMYNLYLKIGYRCSDQVPSDLVGSRRLGTRLLGTWSLHRYPIFMYKLNMMHTNTIKMSETHQKMLRFVFLRFKKNLHYGLICVNRLSYVFKSHTVSYFLNGWLTSNLYALKSLSTYANNNFLVRK